jgi:adenine phosphoribosyltransferase
LILDDLLATGGSAFAASQLIKLAGGNPIGAVFIVELMELEGARRLEGVPVRSLFQY